MKTEKKYRAWKNKSDGTYDKVVNKMFYFDKKYPYAVHIYSDGSWSFGGAEDCSDEVNSENGILMESIGYKDKKGVEIYIGDIVTDTANARNKREWSATIEQWDSGEFGFSHEHPAERSLFELWERGRLKVIGNIFENPELVRV